MKLIKFGSRLIGSIIAAVVLLTALGALSGRAMASYERSGAYCSELLVWEQEQPDEGRLIICGKPFRVDLGRLSSLSGAVRQTFSVSRDELTESRSWLPAWLAEPLRAAGQVLEKLYVGLSPTP